MKTKTSVMKKTASVAAGGALLAALYANAVFVPQSQDTARQRVDAQIQSVNKGEAEFVAEADGFKVVELVEKEKSEIRQLADAITKLQAELEDQAPAEAVIKTAAVEVEPVRAAYQPEEVVRTAQTDPFAQLRTAAAQISSISGLPIGATIGALASITADPLLSAGATEVINASVQPGGLSQAITVGGGLSSQATAVLALLGVQSVGGIGGGSSARVGGGLAGANASTGAGSSTGTATST